MTYKEYVDLGFTRSEMDCGVSFNETGYGGFALTKNINEKMMIEAISEDLNSPKLYIRKGDGDSYHIFKITPEAVKDLLSNNMPPVGEQKCVVPNCKNGPIKEAFHGLCSQHIWPNG
jgi:hypothetical protein